jgi:DNA replication protein DnaC
MNGINSFDNFKPIAGTEQALALFKELAAGADWYMLLCGGTTGCGKTHLCEALAGELTKKLSEGYCPVIVWEDLISRLKSAFSSEHRGEFDARFSGIKKMKQLILDDIGMGTMMTEWEWSILEAIVDYRYRNELLTVVSTNMPLDKFPKRIVSRFSDALTSRKVANRAEDYRPKKEKSD